MKDIKEFLVNESNNNWVISQWLDDYKGVKVKWDNNVKYLCICTEEKTIVPFTKDEIEDLDDDILDNVKKLTYGESYISAEDDHTVMYIKIDD